MANSQRIPEIDGLRGIAILSVIFWHYCAGAIQTIPGSAAAYTLLPFSLTHTGVHLFFVLSGFLIGGILIDAKNSETFFKTFYIRRFFRIIPLYYLVGTAYVIGATYFAARFHFMFDHAQPPAVYALLLQDVHMAFYGVHVNGFSHTWSLAVEEQFYILLPIAIRFMPRRWLVTLLIAIIVITPIRRHRMELESIAAIFRFTNLDFFSFGVLAAMIYRDRIKIVAPKLLLGGGVAIYALMALHQMPLPTILHPTALGISYTLIVLGCITDAPGTVSTILRLRPLQAAGIQCFGLYLLHIPVQAMVFALILGRTDSYPMLTDLASVSATMLSVCITCVLAITSWKLIERPLIAYSHRWSYRPRQIPLCA